jgi:ornithine cyclodeaminase
MVLEPDTGRLLALMEGSTLTAIRTGAASGAATDLLAPKDAKTVAIFGAGAQAPTQLEAVCAVREIETAWIYSRTPERTDALIESIIGKGLFPADIRRAESPRDAVANADIICTATASTDRPVFDDTDLKPGVHINAVGSFQPQVAEIPPETIERAWVVVDGFDAAKEEAGDLIQPVEAGRIGWDHLRAELGELILGEKSACPADGQPTFFKSVGLAAQDALAAKVALENARKNRLGIEAPW